jgi:hypothetical protein
MEVMRMETTEFKDVRFMTAAEKKRVLRQWKLFLKSGFDARLFMKSLYHHLIQHCSFIAHYNLSGFYGVYFEDPSATQRFLDQFDRSKGCLSVEYGYAWINDEDYRDINNAMVDAAAELLPTLRRMLKERETAKARQELEQAERRLKAVLATE